MRGKNNSLELWLSTNDDTYFKDVYSQYYNGLFRYVHRIVRDEDIAHDIVSDTFCSVLQNKSQYDSQRGAFSTWLYNIAQNAAFAWLNQEKKQDKIREGSSNHIYHIRGIDTIEGEDEVSEELANESFDVELEPLLGILHQRIIYEIQGLSDVYRDCVYDREVRGLSYDVISRRRNLNINTVKSKIRLGRDIILRNIVSYMKEIGIEPQSLMIVFPDIRRVI
jgi:RNA polymerase sigma factor (sigma-70 family)